MADPLTIQAFETAVVNSNFQLLETQGTTNSTNLSTLATQAFNSKVRARAFRATAAVSSGTGRTAVTLSDIDTAFSRTDSGSWSIVSGSLAVPVGAGGEYLARFRLQWPSGTATADRLLECYINNASAGPGIMDTRGGSTSVTTYVTVFEALQLTANQRVQPAIAQNSGGALTAANIDVTLWKLGAI